MKNVFVITSFDLSLPIDYNPIKIQKEIEAIMKTHFKNGQIISEVNTEMALDQNNFPIFVGE